MTPEQKKQIADMVYKAMIEPKFANEEGLRALNAANDVIDDQIRKYNIINRNG